MPSLSEPYSHEVQLAQFLGTSADQFMYIVLSGGIDDTRQELTTLSGRRSSYDLLFTFVSSSTILSIGNENIT